MIVRDVFKLLVDGKTFIFHDPLEFSKELINYSFFHRLKMNKVFSGAQPNKYLMKQCIVICQNKDILEDMLMDSVFKYGIGKKD